jgi:hypothetical protein
MRTSAALRRNPERLAAGTLSCGLQAAKAPIAHAATTGIAQAATRSTQDPRGVRTTTPDPSRIPRFLCITRSSVRLETNWPATRTPGRRRQPPSKLEPPYRGSSDCLTDADGTDGHLGWLEETHGRADGRVDDAPPHLNTRAIPSKGNSATTP